MSTSWESALAATKLRPPVPPSHLVPRSRLTSRLDEGVDRRVRLILVSAPAGSGKSTLIASWASRRPEPVAWLQVESSDGDPTRFWSYLVDALGLAAALPVDDLRSVAIGSNGDAVAVVTAVVNALAELDHPVVVIVDDFHLIDDETVHRGVERLIELCPDHVTIVLGTHVDPPFRLGRLRVREQLVEIRSVDLRFDPDEAAGLLATALTVVDRELIDELCERTEGWAAGLVLAGLSLERADDPAEFITGFGGDDQLVVEYVRDELLSSVPAEDHDRLLVTSILDHLTGDLVDAVTGRPGGARWLRHLAASNQLLIGLDRSGTWFRYHHLLRDLLRLELTEQLPELVPDLHVRAAIWFEAAGDHRRAATHRLAAGDLDGVARLLLVLGPELIADGQIETLRGFLDAVADVIGGNPWLTLLAGWGAFISGHYERASAWLDQLLMDPPAADPTLAVPLHINVCLARGDVGSALELAQQMTATGQLASHSGDLATATGAARTWAGRFDEARDDLRLAVDKTTDQAIRTAHVLALVYGSIAELESGALATAHTAAVTTLDTAAAYGLTAYHGIAPAYAVRARTGEPGSAAADVHQALTLARRSSTDLVHGYVLATCGDTLLDLGDPTGSSLLAEARTILGRCPDPGIARAALARAESRHGLRTDVDADAEQTVEALTDRELAVLRYLPSARSQRDIADELYVSLNTVKTHCRAIYRKLGVGDRRAAVLAARDRRLI